MVMVILLPMKIGMYCDVEEEEEGIGILNIYMYVYYLFIIGTCSFL